MTKLFFVTVSLVTLIIVGGILAYKLVVHRQNSRVIQRSPSQEDHILRAKKARLDFEKSRDAWQKNYSTRHPRAQIKKIYSHGHVDVLIYLPEITYGDVWIYVNDKKVSPSYSGLPGDQLGTTKYTFAIPLRTMKDDEYKVSIVDTSTGDEDSRSIIVKGGEVKGGAKFPGKP